MESSDIHDILAKYRSGTCTAEEKALVENWVMYGKFPDLDLSSTDLKEDLSAVSSRLPLAGGHRSGTLWKRISAAAAVLIIIATGLYFGPFSPGKTDQPQDQLVNDVSPGGNKAILTLADGRKIALDDADKGQLAEQSGIKVSKTADGQLTYDVSGSDVRALKINYNIIETPVGGQYQIILPDGSKVWLNSTSSLRFPTAFTQSQRTVELKGEAYFEIKHSKTPFLVKTNNQEVEVLGTHFNISNYPDEAYTKTTLLEGSVKVRVSKGTASKILLPGQQAAQQSDRIQVKPVDAEAAIAWKNGLFIFDDESLEAIMRSVARWYGIEVIYEKDVNRNLLFGGSVSRYDNVSKVIDKLELTGGVHFKIDGRRITVMK
jgi:ferric-dicitrate binding protein FerR (iron transport regulator)